MNRNKQFATWWGVICYHSEQLEALISSVDIKGYAYCLHDKCKNEDGTLKKAHYQCVVQLNRQQRGSWFKRFSTEDMGQLYYEPLAHPESAHNYLTHNTPKAIKDGQYIYSNEELVSTFTSFEPDIKEICPHQQDLFDLFDMLDGNLTWHQFLQKKPKRIHSISNYHKAFVTLYKERNAKNRLTDERDILGLAMNQSKVSWRRDELELIEIVDAETEEQEHLEVMQKIF